jgi:hypothetical protein
LLISGSYIHSMKIFSILVLLALHVSLLQAQNDEQRIRSYLKERLHQVNDPEKVWLFQCKYKPGKEWQYLIACINTVNKKPVTTLLFAERVQDSLLHIEPFHFNSVEAFDHINIDKSRDNIEELYITTSKDSGNLSEKHTGIYSCKKGFVDTLINFYSFEIKSLKAPYFTYQPGLVVEQEGLCKLTDVNGDGKIDIASRVHRKIINKEPGTGNYTFDHETDYTEYRLNKGRFTKMASTKIPSTVDE